MMTVHSWFCSVVRTLDGSEIKYYTPSNETSHELAGVRWHLLM